MADVAVRGKQARQVAGRSVTMQISAALLERIDAQADTEQISRSAVIHRVLRDAFPDPERDGN